MDLSHTGMRWGYPQMTQINADKDRGDSETYAIIGAANGGAWGNRGMGFSRRRIRRPWNGNFGTGASHMNGRNNCLFSIGGNR